MISIRWSSGSWSTASRTSREVSACSACSSGKAGPSRALEAMGLGPEIAGSAIRVSLGPTTPGAEVAGFAAAWEERYRRFRLKSA